MAACLLALPTRIREPAGVHLHVSSNGLLLAKQQPSSLCASHQARHAARSWFSPSGFSTWPEEEHLKVVLKTPQPIGEGGGESGDDETLRGSGGVGGDGAA